MAFQKKHLYLNVLATAVSAAEKAGEIIRQVMSSGNLEIVLKVIVLNFVNNLNKFVLISTRFTCFLRRSNSHFLTFLNPSQKHLTH